MQQQTTAYLLAGLAIVFWSTVATAFKLTLRHIDPLPLILYSCVFSAVTLFVIAAIQGKLTSLRMLTVRQYLIAMFLGLLNPALYYFVLFNAYDRLPAQQAMTINYSWPVMLVILSAVFLKQVIFRLEMVAIGVAYIGVVVIATGGKFDGLYFSDSLGTVFAILSTGIWAAYWLLNVKSNIDPVVNLLIGFSFAVPVLLVVIAIISAIEPGASLLSLPNIYAIAGAGYIGLFEMGITFVLWSTALKLSETTAKISGLIFFTPFLSLLVIALLVGEKISPATIVGLTIVLVGIALQKYAHHRVRQQPH